MHSRAASTTGSPKYSSSSVVTCSPAQPDSQPDRMSLGTIVAVRPPAAWPPHTTMAADAVLENHHEPVAVCLHFGTTRFGHRLAQNGEVVPPERVHKIRAKDVTPSRWSRRCR